VSSTTNGSLTLNTDGSFTYTPNSNFNGTDAFTYLTNDGTLDSNVATVTLTVNAVNDAPVAVDDTFMVDEDNTLTISAPGVLGNDTDVDSAALTALLVSSTTNGSLTLNTDGSFTYTPNSNFNGTDAFTYRTSDGADLSNVATVSLTINAVNDAPIARDDAATTDENATLIVAAPGLLFNDTDVDTGDILAVATVSGVAANVGTTFALATGALLTVNADGSYTYNPNGAFEFLDTGEAIADSFTYTARDAQGAGSNLATATIIITGVNDAPVASNDSYTTNEDTPLTITAPGVLFNDVDVEGDSLAALLVTGPANGLLVLNADGSFSYIPNADFNGSDAFTYRASDGTDNSNVATVTLLVTAVDDNNAPTAHDDSFTVAEDGTLTVTAPGVLGNDTDADNDTLTAALVTGPAFGSLVFGTDGSFSYVPNADFFGADSFTYRANDGEDDSSAATVTLTVTAVNDAPLANDDSATTTEDQPVTIAALANDADVDNALFVAAFSQGVNGTVVQNADGTFTYTPAPDFNGTDSFTYTLDDGEFTDTATVTITVNAVNDAPAGIDDTAATGEDTPVTIAVLANDTDIEGDTLTVAAFTDADHGAVVLNLDDTFTYTPNPNYFGPDAFSYAVSDGNGGFDTATVFLTVSPVNDAPVANDDALAAVEDTPVTYAAAQLLANDLDVEDDTLIIASVTSGAGGTAILNGDGTVSFTPDAGFTGTASFTYTASDGSLLSNVATVLVAVQEAGGDGAIDVEKYVKLSGDRHKGNEGVGNGEDPPPPGHDFNQNDGPGTSPGNPGSKGGQGHDDHDHDDHDHDDHDHDGHDHDGHDHGHGPRPGHGGGFGLDADSGPGLIAGAGEAIVFTYVLTNPGTVAIANVTLVDDNETPGAPEDDFRPDPLLRKGYNVGDSDRDGLLDPGEAWIYTWSTLVTEGQHVNIATATGATVEGGSTVSDSDAAYWLGVDREDASIGNFVWDDRDRDGIQDRDEKGIKGVTVKLLDGDGTVVATRVTDKRGFYHFTDLASGTYTVVVTESNFAHGGALAGWQASPQDRGSSDVKDSDGDPVTHRSQAIVLAAGQQNSSVDFGFKAPAHDDDCGKPDHDDKGHDRDHDGRGHDYRDDWDNRHGPADHHERDGDNDRGKDKNRIDWSDCFRPAYSNPYGHDGKRGGDWTFSFDRRGKK
jgi:VCBS repeat-containing protein